MNSSGATPMAAGGQSPPSFLSPNFERMPPELRQLPNWVLWVAIWNGSKWTKRPIQPSGYGASTTKPKHWSPFDQARQAYEQALQIYRAKFAESDSRIQAICKEL